MMLKYTVGWAFAFAVEAQLAELKRDRPELCDGGSDADGNHHQGGAADCFRLDLAAAAALTALSGLVLLVAKPLAYDIECGDHTRRKSRPAPHMARLFSGQRRASRAVEPLPAAPACGGVASTHMGLICGSLTIPTHPPRRPLAARLLRGAAGGLVGDGGARPLGLGHGAVVRHQLVRHRHTPLGLKASLKACTRTFAHHLLYVWTHAHALARPRRARPLRATHAHVQPVRDVWARGRSAPPRPSPRQAPRAVGRLDHLRGLLRNRTHVETRPVSCDHGQPGLRCCDWPRTRPN